MIKIICTKLACTLYKSKCNVSKKFWADMIIIMIYEMVKAFFMDQNQLTITFSNSSMFSVVC